MRFVTLLALVGCNQWVGNGEADTRRVDLTGVVEIENHGPLPLFVEVGEGEEQATLTCDSNLMRYIEVEVTGDRLVFDTKKVPWLSPQTECRLEATVATLESVANMGSGLTQAEGDLVGFAAGQLMGSGPLTIEGIDSTDVVFDSSGSGALVASGTTDWLEIVHSGSGRVDAEDLVAVDASIASHGSGPTGATVTGDVEVNLNGSGSVDVYGDPEGSLVNDNGSGSVNVH